MVTNPATATWRMAIVTAPVMDALVIVLRQNLPNDQYETMLTFKCKLIKLWKKEKVKFDW